MNLQLKESIFEKIPPKYGMLASVIVSSFSGVFVRMLEHLPAFQIAFIRTLFGLLFTFYAIRRRNISFFSDNKKLLFLRGLCGGLALITNFYAVQKLPLATAITFRYLAPIFTVLIAMLMVSETPSKRQVLALFLGFLGVVFIKGFDPTIHAEGFLCALFAPLFMGIAYNIIRKLKQNEHPLIIMFAFPLVAAPLLAPFAWHFWEELSYLDCLYLLGIGISLQLGQLFMTSAYQNAPAHKIVHINYIAIPISIIYGYYVFNDQLSFATWLGIGVIFSALIVGASSNKV